MTTQLTEPELAFIADLVTGYKNRRLAALKKATRRSHSADLEILSINSLVNKLEALHSQALEASPQTIANDLPEVAESFDDESPVTTPLPESLG